MGVEVNNENPVLYPQIMRFSSKKNKNIPEIMEPFVIIADIQGVNSLDEVTNFKPY